MTVVGVAHSAAEAFAALELERPDLILMDLGLPDQSGLDAGKQILRQYPETKILALTARGDQWAVDDAIKAGFLGFVTKDTGVSEFVQAVRTVVGGQVVLPRRASNGHGPAEDEGATLLAEHLTPREREVLALLVQGASGDAIARPLGISPNTVRTHVQSILTKLQVHSRLEAAAFAVRHHVVDDPAAAPRTSRPTGTER